MLKETWLIAWFMGQGFLVANGENGEEHGNCPTIGDYVHTNCYRGLFLHSMATISKILSDYGTPLHERCSYLPCIKTSGNTQMLKKKASARLNS